MEQYDNIFKPTEFDPYGVEERDEFIELVEVAEENARAELGEFGYCEAPFDTAGAEDWPDETYTTPSWYAAWHDACNDLFDLMGELASDEVLGLA